MGEVVRQLELMNSSCFKRFVSWITNIQEMESDKQSFAVELIDVTEQ